jgi:hypothetical protein
MLQTMPRNDFSPDNGTEGTPDAAHFQAMRQAGANVIALGKRKNLRLVLHAAESRGKDDTVVILLKGSTLWISGRFTGTQTLS